jgi:hypothetical protein
VSATSLQRAVNKVIENNNSSAQLTEKLNNLPMTERKDDADVKSIQDEKRLLEFKVKALERKIKELEDEKDKCMTLGDKKDNTLHSQQNLDGVRSRVNSVQSRRSSSNPDQIQYKKDVHDNEVSFTIPVISLHSIL